MRLARRFVTALGLMVMIGACSASTAAAGELLGAAGAPDEPNDSCPILALPLLEPCNLTLPIEIAVAPEPAVSIGSVEVVPPVAVTELLPPIEPLEPLEPLEPAVAEVIALVPPIEAGVGPTSSGPESGPEEALSVPTWSPVAAQAGAVPEGQGAGSSPSPAAEATAVEPERAATSPPVAPRARLARPDAAVAEYAAFTDTKARAVATTARANPAAAAVGAPAVPVPLAVMAMTPAITSAAAVAMDLARTGGGWAASIVFNVWLRRQLRERRMSQRQLAAFSGVDHSTISRLLSGARAPSLATATKLAEGLRKLGGPDHAADYFARLSESQLFPTKRVEAALLGDDELEDEDVRELMNAYLVLRARRRRQRTAASENGEGAS